MDPAYNGPASWDALIREHNHTVRKVVKSTLAPNEELDEALQNIWCKIIEKDTLTKIRQQNLTTHQIRSHLSALTFRTRLNTRRGLRRAKKHRKNVLEALTPVGSQLHGFYGPECRLELLSES